MAVGVCSTPKRHVPRPHVIQLHHSPPKSWTTDDGASSTLVPLCGSCHDTEHELLNLFIHHAGQPAKTITKAYDPYLVDLAATAWARRPSDHPPYTATHKEQP